jgi:hypothetical protein
MDSDRPKVRIDANIRERDAPAFDFDVAHPVATFSVKKRLTSYS